MIYWTSPIEVHSDVNPDCQILKINMFSINEHCVPTSWFNPFQRPPGLGLEWIVPESSGLRICQSTIIVRLTLTKMSISGIGSLWSTISEPPDRITNWHAPKKESAYAWQNAALRTESSRVLKQYDSLLDGVLKSACIFGSYCASIFINIIIGLLHLLRCGIFLCQS